jgi:peptidoglycan/xylan/chitin deacetylase (PgdA/CDA1 family)
MMPDKIKASRRDFLKTGAVTVAAAAGVTESGTGFSRPGQATGGDLLLGDKVVVLTFDDAVKTHRTLVAPRLKELGFGATFFITHRWMVDDPEHYMTWKEVAEIHQMGFEIGSHSWTHPAFSVPRDAARLPAELVLVERELRKVGVPKPISFAYCGNHWGPEAVQHLIERDYLFGRRGESPETPWGALGEGAIFDPHRHHRLLVPSAGVIIPGWTMERFRRLVDRARPGEFVVLQFHGIPDPHAFASNTPEQFSEYMAYLKEQGFKVVALKDTERYLPKVPPADPLLKVRILAPGDPSLRLPAEMEATQADLDYWIENMFRHHHYTWEEGAQVTGVSADSLKASARAWPMESHENEEAVRVLPYPGGRNPRIGGQEGAICPQRGTKASVFLPWDPASYVVVDLPEAIFSNLGLTFLAHTDVPTIWDAQNIWLENTDWTHSPNGRPAGKNWLPKEITFGSLSGSRVLPNKIALGASVQPSAGQVDMELWLRNDTPEKLSGMRTLICVLLKGAPDFNAQTLDNKIFRSPVAAVRSAKEDRWILVAWDRCGRAWGEAKVPCMHADPVLEDCLPGQTVRVRGRIWFYEGKDIDGEIQRASGVFSTSPSHKLS